MIYWALLFNECFVECHHYSLVARKQILCLHKLSFLEKPIPLTLHLCPRPVHGTPPTIRALVMIRHDTAR